jgi:cell division protein FtsN
VGQYFLQLGAFRSQEQAKALRARLEEFAKLKPRLEQINLEYASWYRVKLGPYQTIPDANQVRLFLRDRNIDSIMQAAVD